MTVAIVVVVILLVGAGSVISSYNRFVRQGQYIDNSWSNVETELRRRYDLIPNLVEVVKGYAEHENATLESVAAARAGALGDQGSPEHQAQSENALVGSLKSLLALSEAYPNLEADRSFADLTRQLTATEDRIQAARRFFNNNVRVFNERVGTVPSNIIASIFGFELREYFNIDEIAAQNLAVAFNSPDADEPEVS